MHKFKSIALSGLIVMAVAGAAGAANTDLAKRNIEEARHALERGEPNSAKVRLAKALEIDPGNGEAHFLLAQALTKAGDLTDVESHLHAAEAGGYDADEVAAALADAYVRLGKYGKILDELPEGNRRSDLEARVRTARGYAQLNLRQMADAENAFRQGIAIAQTGLAQTRIVSGDLIGANDLLESAVASDSKLVDPWILLGRVRSMRSDPAGARKAFDSAVALAPDNIVALLGRAALLIDSDETQAETDISAILAQAPDNWKANLLDAIIKARHEKWRDAEAALMTISAPEQMPEVLYLLARVNLAQNQIGQADANITHYLAIAPNDPKGLAIKAEVLAQRGKLADAIDLLKQAIAVSQDNAGLLALLSDAYTKNRQVKEAAETLDRLSAIAPRNAESRIQLAERRIAIGRINDALDDIAIARALEPLSPKATSVAIEALLAGGQLDKAAQATEELRRQSPDSPVPETYLGLIAVRRGGLAEAREHFEKALALQPTFVTAAINLAQTYRAEKRFDDARMVFDRTLRQDTKNETLLMARVELERADNKLNAAIDWLERARVADPQALAPRFQLVAAYLDRKDAANAMAVAHELAAMAPRDPRALAALAEAQLADNNRQTAINTYDKVIEMTSGAPEPLLRLANVLATGGDVQGGYRLMRKALDSNPGEKRVHQAMLEFSMRTGNVGASADFVRELLVRRPGDVDLELLLGRLYEADRQFERAARAYQTGFDAQPNADLVQGLARSQAHLSIAAGITTLQAWLSKQPEDRETRVLLASLLESDKQYDAAAAEYERVLAAEPKNPVALNNLATLYSLRSDARALDIAERAYSLAPQSPTIQDTLGWILVNNGETKRGLELLRQAAGGAAGPTVRYHLAVALSKSGEREDAVRVLTDLLESGAQFDDLTAAQQLKAKLGG